MEPETILNNKYRMIERLGGGGFGEVWRAHDIPIDRDVANRVPSSIGKALNRLEAATVIRILLPVNPNRSGELLARMDPAAAARVLKSIDPRIAAEKLAYAAPRRRAAEVLIRIKPDVAAKILTAMHHSHPEVAPEIISQCDGDDYLDIIEALRHESEAVNLVTSAEASKRRLAEHVAPWTRSLRASTWLLVAITSALDGAVVAQTELWPFLICSIPAGIAAFLGARRAERKWYTRLRVLVIATIIYATACVTSILAIFPGQAIFGLVFMAICAIEGARYTSKHMQ